MIEQQEAANEELQSANEEVQSANEELQSTNEELETSKEEIQSSNEELATVNDELNNRNGELNRVNNDLVNLLEDIRRTVPEEIKASAKARYGDVDDDAYAILHAQFVSRLLGQMSKRGMTIPKALPLTLQGLVHRHAVLAPLKTLVT